MECLFPKPDYYKLSCGPEFMLFSQSSVEVKQTKSCLTTDLCDALK